MDETRFTRIEGTNRWVYRAVECDGALFPMATARDLSRLVRGGQWGGAPVEAVMVSFVDAETAWLNAAPLEFLGLEAAHGEKPVVSQTTFSAREDFGISPGGDGDGAGGA